MDSGHLPVKRVLVVDDNPAICTLMRTILENRGYAVGVAENGKQAMNHVRDEGCDVMITDLVMPEQEGIETILLLRREYPGVKVIAMSGAFGGAYLSIAKSLGARRTLAKPVLAETLLKTVEEVLAEG